LEPLLEEDGERVVDGGDCGGDDYEVVQRLSVFVVITEGGEEEAEVLEGEERGGGEGGGRGEGEGEGEEDEMGAARSAQLAARSAQLASDKVKRRGMIQCFIIL